MPSYERGLALPAMFGRFLGPHPRCRETTVRRKPVGESATLVLMQAGEYRQSGRAAILLRLLEAHIKANKWLGLTR